LELLATPDGQRIVERGAGALVQVHYAGSRPDAVFLSGHRGAVRLAGFAGVGAAQTIHSVDATGEARVYAVGTPAMSPANLVAVHGGGSVLRAAARDVARTALATLTADGKVTVVSLATGALAWSRTESLAAVQHLDLSAQGQAVVAVNAQRVQVWRNGAPSQTHDTMPVQRAYLDASGLHILCLGRDNRAEVVEVATGRKIGALEWTSRSGAQGAHTAVAVPQGGWALYCADGKVRFPNSMGAEWREAIAVFEVATLRVAERGSPLLLVGRFGGRALRLQDLTTGGSTWPHARPTASIVDADLDASGTTVVAIANDGSLTISDARDGTPWMERNLSGAAATACALSADGTRVLVGGSDGLVRIYDKDPLPAALRRLPRKLEGWEVELEQGLAAPLRFEPRAER
jgi:WD40 repeat protein